MPWSLDDYDNLVWIPPVKERPMLCMFRLIHIPPHTTEENVFPFREIRQAAHHMKKCVELKAKDKDDFLYKLGDYLGQTWRYRDSNKFSSGQDEWWAVKVDLYSEETPFGPSSP